MLLFSILKKTSLRWPRMNTLFMFSLAQMPAKAQKIPYLFDLNHFDTKRLIIILELRI